MNATLHISPQVVEFAQAVREQLADLPAEEVDDLTEGLEADLSEAFAEDLARELPDPADYALELRTAAGLPPQARQVGALRGLGSAWRNLRTDMAVALRRNSAMAAMLDFVLSLRPFWWVTRAVIAYMFAVWMTGDRRILVPHSLSQWAVLAAAVIVSVQWGRGQWQRPWMRRPLILGNVIAAIVLVPVLVHQGDQTLTWPEAEVAFGFDSGGPAPVVDEPKAGVLLNGEDVTNIFAYGADGKALTGIQLFDQKGHPLATSVPGGNGCLENTPCVDGNGGDGAGVWVPSVLETGVQAWNVFPMLMQSAKFDVRTGALVADPQFEPSRRTAPFVKVPALMPTAKAGSKVARNND